MNKRIAKKVLTRTELHWTVYFNGSFYSMVPKQKSKALYLKACKTLKRQAYYDSEWLDWIYEHFVRLYPRVPTVSQFIRSVNGVATRKTNKKHGR